MTYRPIECCVRFAAVLALFPAATLADAGARLTAAQVASDVALAEPSLAHLHPGYTRYASDEVLEAAWADVVARAERHGGMSTAALYLEVSRVLAGIRCNHTKAELSPALSAARKTTPTYLPFRWQLIGRPVRGIVVDPVPGIGIEPGDEVLSIDGVRLAELVRRYEPYVPVDGRNDHARQDELAFSSEFAGGAIEHFGALAAPPGPTVTLTLSSADGRIRTVVAPRLTGAEWRTHVDAAGVYRRDFRDTVALEFIGDDVAVLAIDTFVNYRRPVPPAAVYDPVFRAIAARGVSTLILDLRENGGGSADAQLALFQRLLTRPMRLLRDVTAGANTLGPAEGHVSSWDRRAMALSPDDFTALPNGRFRVAPDWAGPALDRLEPHPVGYRGELVILVDATLSSGSNHLVSRLVERPGVTVVGTPGGGSAAGVTAGVLYTLTLPASGIRVRIPAWQQWIDRDVPDDGRGVVPHVQVATTVTDWRLGADPQLEAALALSRKR